MIYIQVKRKNEKLMAEQIEWVLTLIYFEKNSQRCKNKKYEKYKYCSDLGSASFKKLVPQICKINIFYEKFSNLMLFLKFAM